MLKISKRLEQVAGMVPKGTRLADVGTDHGYVPLWLLERGLITSAIGMDVNKGPLLRAEENRNKYGFQEMMELRLSDGLEKLKPGEADTVLAAGMGGPLMIRILEEGTSVLMDIDTLVLQPQSEIASVRRYLLEHDFRIQEEIMLVDEGKYYMAMKAVHGITDGWTETEYLFGKHLLENKHPVLLEYLKKEKALYQSIKTRLEKESQTHKKRYQEVCIYLDELDRGLKFYL
ncbi:MAG: class I SAM-dependent methyltransferase [Lachnospiraceae bacterium]|nr:class I SAM-dependent methyltransferase [Lachnospiraceae bacterium]